MNYYGKEYYSDYISHHGILGQKWGVRRYQNKDGSLTSLGKYKKYISDYTIYDIKNSEKRIIESGVTHVDEDTDILKDKSIINRLSTSNEPLDENRKYVTITQKDKNSYIDQWESIGIDVISPDKMSTVSEYVYEAKKDIRIATGKNVSNYVINNLANDDEKKCLLMMSNMESKYLTYDIPDGTKDKENFYKDSDKAGKAYKRIMKENIDVISKHFSDSGYDAIVDIEDYYMMTDVDYPLIVLNPKNSLSLKNEKVW